MADIDVDPVEGDLDRVELTPDGPVEADPQGSSDLVEGDLDRADEADPVEVDRIPIAVLPVLLLAGNSGVLAAATSWHVAGALGLAGTAVVTGVSTAAGAGIRRAHRAEAARRQAETGDTKARTKASTNRSAGAAARSVRAQRRADRLAARRARAAGAGGLGPVTGLASLGAALPRRRGGGLGVGRPRAGMARGLGRSGPGPLSRLATGAGARRGAGAGAGLGRGLWGSRSGGAARVAGAGAAGGRRSAGGGGRLVAGLRRAGAGGGGWVGRGTHAVAGSRPVRAASGAARRTTAALGRVAGQARRVAGQARGQVGRQLGGVRGAAGGGRAAWRGARAARGRSVPQVARSVRRAMADHRKQVEAAAGGQPVRRRWWSRLLRGAAAVAVPVAAGTAVGAWRAGRGSSRWTWWALRAAAARARYQPIPVTPRQRDLALAQADAEAEASESDDEQERPPVADVVEDPGHAGSGADAGPEQMGAEQMAAFGRILEELSEQMVAAAARYSPTGMVEWGEDMRHLEVVLANVGRVLRALQAGSESEPVAPPVREAIGTVAGLQSAASSAAAEIYAVFRAAHAADLARHDAPRPNEAKWDLGNNR